MPTMRRGGQILGNGPKCFEGCGVCFAGTDGFAVGDESIAGISGRLRYRSNVMQFQIQKRIAISRNLKSLLAVLALATSAIINQDREIGDAFFETSRSNQSIGINKARWFGNKND